MPQSAANQAHGHYTSTSEEGKLAGLHLDGVNVRPECDPLVIVDNDDLESIYNVTNCCKFTAGFQQY